MQRLLPGMLARREALHGQLPRNNAVSIVPRWSHRIPTLEFRTRSLAVARVDAIHLSPLQRKDEDEIVAPRLGCGLVRIG